MHTQKHTNIHTYKYKCKFIYMHTYIYVYICIHIYHKMPQAVVWTVMIYIHLLPNPHAYIYTHIRYIYTHLVPNLLYFSAHTVRLPAMHTSSNALACVPEHPISDVSSGDLEGECEPANVCMYVRMYVFYRCFMQLSGARMRACTCMHVCAYVFMCVRLYVF
jgi:hypothetical protein